MSSLFNALSFPLNGTRLIEASAGTGKTYSLSNLYIRLLLGVGGANNEQENTSTNFARPLAIDEILVLTFTNAATAELRERIGARIEEALTLFQKSTLTENDDKYLSELKQSIDPSLLPTAINRLRYAQALIDQSSIYTIHSFCQRLLQDNNFAIQENSFVEVSIDNQSIIENVLLDIWRRLTSNELSKIQLAAIQDVWSSFGKENQLSNSGFQYEFKSILENFSNTPIYQQAVNIDDNLESIIDETYFKNIDEMKALGRSLQQELQAYFATENIKYANRYYPHINAFIKFCEADYIYNPDKIKKPTKSLIEIFSTSNVMHNAKEEPPASLLKLFALNEALHESENANYQARLKQWVFIKAKQALSEYKRQHNIAFPNDVLQTLEKALDKPWFQEKIRQRFPVALIDEFQDTDLHQYKVFNKIYSQANNEDYALVFIGDPKQAIYKFRGADLNTYLTAKAAIPSENIYSMDNNWRSSPALIAANNYLFSQQENIFSDTAIPYVEINAKASNADNSQLSGVKHVSSQVDNLVLYLANATEETKKDKKPSQNKEIAQQRLFTHTANTIHDLLSGDKTVNDKPIESQDICILVRSNLEATFMQSLLADLGIQSAFLNTKNSIYATNCAKNLLHFLTACINSFDTTAIKTALSTPFYQHTLSQIRELDEQNEYAKYFEHFSDLKTLWEKQGIFVMLNAWMKNADVIRKLKPLDDGLRSISQLQQLAELLQKMSAQYSIPNSLLRQLNIEINRVQAKQSPPTDEQQLHLESDRQLVQISTMHKSKGLEFPIVFIPYAASEVKDGGDVIAIDNSLHIDFANSDEKKQRAFEQSMAEDMRLLYVALTRAKYACYVGLANGGNLIKSAIGKLLGINKDNTSIEELPSHLQTIAQNENISLHILEDEIELCDSNAQTQQAANLSFIENNVQIPHSDWQISSYSHLSRFHTSLASANNDEQGGRDEFDLSLSNTAQTDTLSTNAQAIETTTVLDVFHFPKGATIGEFLHAVLENTQFNNASEQTLQATIESQLLRFGLSHLSERWLPTLLNWFQEILAHPIHTDKANFNLADIADNKVFNELQFYFAVNSTLQAKQLNELLQSYHYSPNLKLNFNAFKGLMTGYIDVFFEHNGQFYICDYKSNFLGYQLDDYQQENMQVAIHEHQYDVQYVIYTLAMHRYLQQRVNNYDYDTHIGGCLYLFLRGMDGNNKDRGVFFDKPPRELIEKLDKLFSTYEEIINAS